MPQAQRRLFVRDLLSRGNRVSTNTAYFVQESFFTNNASPQAGEGAVKSESAEAFTTVARQVITIAHWIPASRQLADDAPALIDFVKGKLLWGLRYREEQEILTGDSTSNHLTGLIPSAATFNTGLLHASTGWNKAEVLRRALQQIERSDEIPAGFFVLHPDDWADIETLRSSYGTYVLSQPREAGPATLWGKPVVVTPSIQSERFSQALLRVRNCSTGWMQRSRSAISIRIFSLEI